MKKYKTWEAIKMLVENPKLRFFNQIANIKVEMKTCDGKVIFSKNNKKGLLESLRLDGEWTLEQEPVSFMEALKSGKRCWVEHGLIEGVLEENECCVEVIRTFVGKISMKKAQPIHNLLNGISWMYNEDEVREIIQNGKWYIEEE